MKPQTTEHHRTVKNAQLRARAISRLLAWADDPKATYEERYEAVDLALSKLAVLNGIMRNLRDQTYEDMVVNADEKTLTD